ncbi:hypothetical protein [Argonema antarcticum]|uniref:hypothetical protein n=1 Tax=Argonema antarcticum TaxID=2942763 RepID=UPI002012CE33|nr:hypothetical protein [Argonema antarcticum]MCL1471833.1 hypothetical protein [Argonema antarcticum A004/B2]
MINLHRGFQLLCRTITSALLVSTIWMFGLPAFSALAMPFTASGKISYVATHLTEEDSTVARSRKMRIDAISECRNYLTDGHKDTPAQLDKPLDKSGSKQLVGALKVTDNPEPTVAEVDFKRCLEEKGIAPKIE